MKFELGGYAMANSNPRLWALQQISTRTPRKFDWAVNKEGEILRVSELMGMNTFSHKVMKKKLSKSTYSQLLSTIKKGSKLDRSIANEVAHAMKEWAIENGATHFCHWFQPQTGLTAEKHDAFINFDDEGQAIEYFSGSQLIQSEPDASSFPSGGRRSTFEARGYTAWDPSSPAFIAEEPNGKTLCIPSVFISYHGDALDYKAPLLRSMEVLSKGALGVLALFGNKSATRVVPTLGPEQEYFLIDSSFYALRPDLVAAGRTLVGSKPPKGQELEDHYFGSIKDRVQAYMQEVEFEAYKLGIPIKTRHNEVAPSQFETAPIFEELNVAADHNQMLMELMRAVAVRHNFALLLHEKPFAGVNGSGKHNNWSMQDSDGNNLLEPGKTPHENLQFLVFLVATLRAVHRRAGLLRAGIASSGNDHRLGANEAPPAIISAFLGEQLTDILDAIEEGTVIEASDARIIGLGISSLPDVARDNTDRNRTSPFAFTGNKFEFRAVASSASVSVPMTYLNAAVAEALDEVKGAIQKKLDSGTEFKQAVLAVVRDYTVKTKAIRFEGNGYADEWVEEAAKRGLPNLRKTPEALAELLTPEAAEFFHKTGVYSHEELEAQYHIKIERYIKDVEIEIELLKELVKVYVLPAAHKQQNLLAGSLGTLSGLLKDDSFFSVQLEELKGIASTIAKLHKHLASFDELTQEVAGIEEVGEKAKRFAYDVLPAMADIRALADHVEETVADEFWTLPKYREMLFLS
jgi:glutamine synthetase